MGELRDRCKGLRVCLLAAALWGASAAATASDGGFYAGVSGIAERIDASYDKTVVNTPPSPRGNRVFSDGDSADDWKFGHGFLAGYRLPLAKSGFFLSGEIDAKFHDVAARGRLAGAGDSDRRNQLGESWPDGWQLAKDKSYGLTLKLGFRPRFSWPGLGEASLYALAGVRRVEAEFGVDYEGCFRPAPPCTPAEFQKGSLRRDEEFVAWTGGLGLEKPFGESLALQGEVRYTGYAAEDWLSFDLDGIKVPAELDGDDLDFSLNLVWYF